MNETEVLPVIAAVPEPPDNADLPGALAAAAPRRWVNRATPWLVATALLAGGYLGGVQSQKHWGKASATSAASSSSRNGGFTVPNPGFSGFPGGFNRGSSGGGEATTGTIKSIADGSLTVQTAAGKTITVTVAEAAKIQQSTTLAKLKTGQSVTVQGTTATDGSIAATSVTAS